MSTKTIVAVVCDRSGREIQGEREPHALDPERDVLEVDPCDLHIHCPWLPAVHGLTYTDLCDEDRRVVANLLLQLAMKRDPKHLAEGKCYDGRSLSEAPAVKRKRGEAEADADKLLPLHPADGIKGDVVEVVDLGIVVVTHITDVHAVGPERLGFVRDPVQNADDIDEGRP